MNVDPTGAASVQPPMTDEGDDLTVWDLEGMGKAAVFGEERKPPPGVADEKLTVYEVVAADRLIFQQAVQFLGIRCLIPEEANPDGGIHQYH